MEKLYKPYRERSHPVWPDGARMAVAMYVALEEWGEESMVKYKHPPSLAPGLISGMNRAELSTTSTVEYGFRVGIYRLMDIWEKHKVAPSLLASAMAMELHPDLFRELIARGHRPVGHGYDQGHYIAQMSPDEQSQDIARCIEITKRICNTSLKGWGSPGTKQTEATLELLSNAGFEFHMGLHDDELPYFLRIGGREMVEIPYRIVDSGEMNDYSMYSRADNRIPSEAKAYVREFIDAKYRSAETKPCLLTLGIHPYISGRPDRAQVVDYFLRYVKGLPDVWITDFDGVAEWAKNNRRLFV